METLQICPPHVSDEATLPWEIQKKVIFQHCDSYTSNKENKQTTNLLFLTAKGWIKSTCTCKHVKEIHTNTSKTANVTSDYLRYSVDSTLISRNSLDRFSVG